MSGACWLMGRGSGGWISRGCEQVSLLMGDGLCNLRADGAHQVNEPQEDV
jgi:hypothetical protein